MGKRRIVVKVGTSTLAHPTGLLNLRRVEALCRVLSDLVCVTVGLVFHAMVGVGTVITALFMGPVIQWFNTHVSEPFLYGKEGKPVEDQS